MEKKLPNQYFKLTKKFNLFEMKEGDILHTSDFFTHDANGNAVQFKFIDNSDQEFIPYEVKPGIWKITKNPGGSMSLESTTFVKDEILEQFLATKEIEEITDTFFNNIHLYKEFGIEIPKRNILLWGPAGTGKSTGINQVIKKYNDGKTAIVVWDTAVFEAFMIKNFIKHFKYINGVEKIILIAEDIGGTENEGRTVRGDSSLLSILDNNEKTFTIPVLIIATTNYITNLEANLANRSGRFDDKIEVDYPNSEQRQALLKFFAKENISEEALQLIGSDVCMKFPPAHIRECYIRSRLRSKPLEEIIKHMIKEIKSFEKGFSKQREMGF